MAEINDQSTPLEISSSLINCIRSSEIETVKHILFHYNLSDYPEWSEGFTLICVALYNNEIEIAKLLLESGAKVNIENKKSEHNTLLHYAVLQRNEEIVELLLKKGADVELFDKNGYTPLLFAAKIGHMKIVQHLINYEANVNVCCGNYTPLYFAIKSNNLEMVELLIQNGANVNPNYSTYYNFLQLAISENNKKIVQLLLENKCSTVEEKSESVLSSETSLEIGTLLHSALAMKRIKIVEMLLNHGFDVNLKNHFERTPMYYAYMYNDLKVCKLLLANGACINSKIDGNMNLLHMAVQNKDEMFVKFLLEENADVNATTSINCTSLHIACRNGCEKIVKLLLKHNIDVHTKNIKGVTSLHEAVYRNNEKIIKLLLRSGSDVNDTTENLSTPLHFAGKCSKKIIQRLLKYGADVNAKDNRSKTALCYGVEKGNMSMVRLLLDKNLDIKDKSNKLAFCLAILGNDSNIVEIFLYHGFSLKSEDFDDIPLVEPFFSKYIHTDMEGSKTIFQRLLKREPSRGAFLEYEILLNSIAKGFVRIVKTLLRNDADLDVSLDHGDKLLHIAVSHAQTWIVEEILKRGANVNSVNDRGRTPLHVGVLKNYTDIVAFLLKYKVDIEACEEDNKTALHLAADGNDHIAKMLLDFGANINPRSYNDTTPLHIAAENGNLKVVKLLLEYDADINANNSFYETPLDLAFYCQKKEVALVLLEHGAVYNMSLTSHNIRISQLIHLHTIKMKVINQKQCSYLRKNSFFSKCKKEIQKMALHQIDFKVSLLDVLIKKDCEVERFMKNKAIFDYFETSNFKEYPIYKNMLGIRSNKAKRRNLLIELAGNSLEFMLEIKIPYLVSQKVFSYISNLDLRHLIHAASNLETIST